MTGPFRGQPRPEPPAWGPFKKVWGRAVSASLEPATIPVDRGVVWITVLVVSALVFVLGVLAGFQMGEDAGRALGAAQAQAEGWR